MEPNTVEAFIRAGQFLHAQEALDLRHDRTSQSISDVLRAWILERTGRPSESANLAQKLLKRRDLPASHKAICEYCLGAVAWDYADEADAGITHIQRAIALAENGGDRWKACFFRLRLLVMVTDRAGSVSAGPILSTLRSECIKLGDPILSAALHVFIAETEIKRGLTRAAERHAKLGKALLTIRSNPWLEAIAETVLTAIAWRNADHATAFRLAERGLLLAKEAGAASMQRACLANLGVMHQMAGRFDEAIVCLRGALAVAPETRGERVNGCYDEMARAYIGQRDYREADRIITTVEASIRSESDWLLWANRHIRKTRADLTFWQGGDGALARIDAALQTAKHAGDLALIRSCHVRRAQILAAKGFEFQAELTALTNDRSCYSVELQAGYECILGLGLAHEGRSSEADKHFQRASEMCELAQSGATLLEVRHLSNLAKAQSGHQSTPAKTCSTDTATGTAIHAVTSLFLHVGRPELVAADVVRLLADSRCVKRARAAIERSDRTTQTLSIHGSVPLPEERITSVEIASRNNERITVSYEPVLNTSSAAVVSDILLLVGLMKDLEKANTEREERLTLWPQEEEPIDEGDGVILGQMRELMTFAKRVAKTNISVLITGESGTGKEILARAVHKYSTRADKPFMPFNCTAVPRDMLESQLFGHRRGAFTSADRDNPGLIRAAKGGTLFLDEIGELGLDLQPKLLRFLESGEISPLGETGPVNVDVRIIAATNRDLEELVRAERFREDLFYRLNVIRLTIPPLRERRDEIPALINYFVARSSHDLGKGQLRVAEETMERFLLYQWPGNIRQLQNEIRRIVALADVDGVLTPDMLTHDIRKAGPRVSHRRDGHDLVVPLHDKLGPTLAHVEREVIRTALKNSRGRLEPAAKALGISRKGLYLKRQRLGL